MITKSNRIAVLALICCVAPSGVGQADLSGPLTLEAAVELLLRRNLAVEAARSEVEVAKAEKVAARLRPRPSLTMTAENLRLSGATPAARLYEVGATISRSFELGGQRGHRLEVADRGVAVAETRLTGAIRRQLFDLKRTYYEALLARALLGIARDNRQSFDALVRFNTLRFEEGQIAEGELLKVRLERIKFDAAIADAELRRRQVMIELLEMIGESDFERAPALELRGSLEIRPAVADLVRLREAALANRPAIRAAESEVSRREAALQLERSRAGGEITPFFGYRRVGVDNTLLAGVTIQLPFGNRNQGGVARSEAELRVAEVNARLVRTRTLAEVESAYRAYEAACEQVKAYEAGILRQADEAGEISLAAYREGAAELIALIEAQRTRAEVRTGYYRALFDYHTRIFELELATGLEIKSHER